MTGTKLLQAIYDLTKKKRRRAIKIPPEMVEMITKSTIKRVAGREA